MTALLVHTSTAGALKGVDGLPNRGAGSRQFCLGRVLHGCLKSQGPGSPPGITEPRGPAMWINPRSRQLSSPGLLAALTTPGFLGQAATMEMPDCDDELYRRFHGRQHEPEQRVDFVTGSTFRTVVFPAEYANKAVDNFYDPSPSTIQADEPQYYSAPSLVASHTFGKPTSSYPRSFTLDDDEEDEDWSVQHGPRPPLFPDNPGWGSATAETERWNAYYGHGTAITTGDQVLGHDDYYPSTDVGRSESPRRVRSVRRFS